MRPKFAIGEEVILQSVIDNSYDGDYIVEEVLYYDGEICYRLEGLKNKRVIEPSLKKKYKPSDMSFTDLMTSIKSNTTA